MNSLVTENSITVHLGVDDDVYFEVGWGDPELFINNIMD